jgi:hypothetical protein
MNCQNGNTETIPYSWIQQQTDVVFVCACLDTVMVQAPENQWDLIENDTECTLNQDCSCHQVYFDANDYNISDDQTLYVRVQECDGSWGLRTFTSPGTFTMCIMNLWPYPTMFSYYIIQGGVPQYSPGASTVTDLGAACSNDAGC